jgi:hypothetical protein
VTEGREKCVLREGTILALGQIRHGRYAYNVLVKKNKVQMGG